MRLALLCMGCACALAQTPAFDVASVKRIPAWTRHGGATREVTPTSVTIRNGTLGLCIYWAYGYEHYQVAGPDWRDYPTDAVYDIVAKTSAPVPAAQMDLMLQTLLKDRLGLVVHREQRQLPVYALVVAKDGLKFQHSTSQGDPSAKAVEVCAVRYERFSMAEFAKTMDPPFTSRHVIDETGLSGVYDFTLDLTPYVIDVTTGKAILDSRGAIDQESADIQALPKELGLRLERKTALLEVMVIDHAEKDPTEN